MVNTELFYQIMLGVQLVHSVEELTHGFHSKFPPFKMSFRFFLVFEILFFLFWLMLFVIQVFPGRETLIPFFILLMFANGLWHLVWYGIVKKYVPGLITAPLFVVVFLVYYFKLF